MNTSLTRSPAFWLLLVLSLASAAVGGWLVWEQVGTMTSTLLDGTATGVEVYVGQSLVVVGAALLGAGVLGVLLTAALAAARSLMRSSVETSPNTATAVAAPSAVDEVTEEDLDAASDESVVADADDVPREETDQNGSSGSTATATKISVK